jgi:hypothetical protein
MKQHFTAHSKTGGKKCEFFFLGKFQVAKVPRCFDNYNINKWKGYEVCCFSLHKMWSLVLAITLY